jgi:hypothetical protein
MGMFSTENDGRIPEILIDFFELGQRMMILDSFHQILSRDIRVDLSGLNAGVPQ